MTIICLEGASAVGKTTTCNEIARISNTYIVPEVNLLFGRPKHETKTWYLERQVERWQIAIEKQNEYELVILDGDIFQPLSYNWCFDFNINDQSLEFIYNFYQKEITKDRIMFPDKYFYLYTDYSNLLYRKENDRTRNRGNFDKHLKIVEPHQRYYEALNSFKPQLVHLVNANSIEENIKIILQHLPTTATYQDSRILLDNITNWLKKNKP